MIHAGTIMAFSGIAGDIPEGWFLCDGQNDTPDLRDFFVKGAESVGGTGGGGSHTHAIDQAGEHSHGSLASGGSHNHAATSESGLGEKGVEYHHTTYGVTTEWAHTHGPSDSSGGHVHDAGAETIEPGYYSVLFIMSGYIEAVSMGQTVVSVEKAIASAGQTVCRIGGPIVSYGQTVVEVAHETMYLALSYGQTVVNVLRRETSVGQTIISVLRTVPSRGQTVVKAWSRPIRRRLPWLRIMRHLEEE